MIKDYTEITEKGVSLEEGWQDKLFEEFDCKIAFSKKKEIGNIATINWSNGKCIKTINLGEPIRSRCISNDRKYISVSTKSGVFIYTDDGNIIGAIQYPIIYNQIIIEDGFISSQNINDGELKFKVITENQDFYIVYSIDNKILKKVEWCR